MALFGCKAKKQLVSTKDSAGIKAAINKRARIASIQSRQLDFSTFSGKARTKLDIDGKSNDVTLNIRIKKDRQIWISITAIAGLEVARALITPDSIRLINRLEGAYMHKPFSYIYRYTSQQINYKTLESLLIGNCIPEQLNAETDIKMDSSGTVITGNLNDLAYKVAFNEALKVITNQLNNAQEKQSLEVKNGDFIQLDNRVFPSTINIRSMVKDKQMRIGLQYIKADFDQNLDFPFSVPGRFSVVN
ncbi:MAG: DUF4292 domain-containing protein [Sphingobacteriaceae bacterium]